MKKLLVIGGAAVMSLALSGVAVGALAGGAPDTGAPGNSATVPSGYTGINDTNLQACMDTKTVCNPVTASELAKQQWSHPLAVGTALLTRAAVEGLVKKSLNASGSPAVFSAQTTGAEVEAMTGMKRSPQIDESRPVWIVTINTPTLTDEGPGRAPEIKSSYSAIVDAATGYITDDCIGCSWLSSSK